MGFELLGPPDEGGNREPLHKWHSRKIAKPYEEGDNIYINLESLTVAPNQAISESVSYTHLRAHET